MKVLVFSDSHGYNMSMAYAIEREKPDAVLHLGDHTDDADDIRRAFPALTIYHVRGNNDFDMDVPLFAVVTVGGVRMYLTHGHRERVSMLHSGLVPARAREGKPRRRTRTIPSLPITNKTRFIQDFLFLFSTDDHKSGLQYTCTRRKEQSAPENV